MKHRDRGHTALRGCYVVAVECTVLRKRRTVPSLLLLPHFIQRCLHALIIRVLELRTVAATIPPVHGHKKKKGMNSGAIQRQVNQPIAAGHYSLLCLKDEAPARRWWLNLNLQIHENSRYCTLYLNMLSREEGKAPRSSYSSSSMNESLSSSSSSTLLLLTPLGPGAPRAYPLTCAYPCPLALGRPIPPCPAPRPLPTAPLAPPLDTYFIGIPPAGRWAPPALPPAALPCVCIPGTPPRLPPAPG